ncbi:hypothetical protein [Candidatus Bathycorpusculum sp.]|jgi:hypothetical protein|uniref:hypothetical protein n=1 Tax=Candidatus Bathycorpusculum sp. TaxID=2994959 RepID=UPI002823C8D4|nr:hypothetical protein [Candidatus Termitimicrobium sp.]MCL2686122.1 hypothetical protein [Candidatus Termitimicrobium sp.]
MRYLKYLIILIAVGLVSCLVLFEYYTIAAPKNSQIQILSPEENTEYQTTNIPLKITTNDANAKITYSIEGINKYQNTTYTEETTLNLSATATYKLTVNVHDTDGNLKETKTTTFTIASP